MVVDLLEILKNKKEKIVEQDGLCFLLKGNEIVNIDFSCNMHIQFKHQRKDYDSYFIFEFPEGTKSKQKLIALKDNIQKYRPKYNLEAQGTYQLGGWALLIEEKNNIDTLYLKCMHFINGKEVD